MLVHGHGDPAHNRMLDEAGDYFHDTYGGEMVNLFGYVWAMDLKEFRTPDQRRQDGLAKHATMTESSVILALQPLHVAKDYKSASPRTGQSIQELVEIASKEDWSGYFGAPALASASLGYEIYGDWLSRSKMVVNQILSGEDYRKLKRYGDLNADDPVDAAAALVNQKLALQHDS